MYLGLFQLAVDTRIPDYAVVSETVELARLTHSHPWIKLVNAISRKAAAERIRWCKQAEHWSMVLPQWLEEYWRIYLTGIEMNQLKNPWFFRQFFIFSEFIENQFSKLIETLSKKYSIVVNSAHAPQCSKYSIGLFSIS